MKHYYALNEAFLENKTVPSYAPVERVLLALDCDGHGASIGTPSKQVVIQPDAQPEFRFRFVQTDTVSADVVPGKRVSSGELIGHARSV